MAPPLYLGVRRSSLIFGVTDHDFPTVCSTIVNAEATFNGRIILRDVYLRAYLVRIVPNSASMT